MADSVSANHFCRPLDIDAAQAGSTGKKSLSAQAKSGSDRSTKVLAFLRDYFELCSSAEIDDDARAAVALNGGDAVSDAIGAEFRRVVDERGHTGLDAGFNKKRFQMKVRLAYLAKGRVERRHNRCDEDIRHLAWRKPIQ